MTSGHPIMRLKFNQFNMAAVSVKRSKTHFRHPYNELLPRVDAGLFYVCLLGISKWMSNTQNARNARIMS